ncbi:MAG: hypothetical protein A2516_05270 [Alphaproteobacteria bacterium RIFOXYD12_FULL_60_8]|nr:MAG: hypothetical protein A2516_05270 [Alphaproteobacteria bacterium RIFOXYD12_FULL_60_8]
MSERDDLLAVYGTLKAGQGGVERLGLTPKLRLLGPCRFKGRLLDLGDYPGAVKGEGVIEGELCRILDAAALPLLDRYEDVRHGLFVREKVPLLEPQKTAWVYWYNRPVTGHPVMESGNWR